MPKLYGKVREQVEKEIRSIEHYATTTDLWSSWTMEPYLSLTIHLINNEWELCSKCLQTSYFPDDHTGEAIAQGLRESLESWGLKEESQVCITTPPTMAQMLWRQWHRTTGPDCSALATGCTSPSVGLNVFFILFLIYNYTGHYLHLMVHFTLFLYPCKHFSQCTVIGEDVF